MRLCTKTIKQGMDAAYSDVCDQDKIWSHYSHDKVDIGEELARVIRRLSKALPLDLKLRALSIGSSDEPQFRILESAFRGGLYLLDININALNRIKERINRQYTGHVSPIRGDYNKLFSSKKEVKGFLKNKLSAKRVHLVSLHHSLYYCAQPLWLNMFKYIYRDILDSSGAIHPVLMSSKSKNRCSTTWLYNHFADKFFGVHNDQDLRTFKKTLQKDPLFKKASITLRTNEVHFNVNDFRKFMKVIWMILLYPQVHKYSPKQREEITEFVYKNFWKKKVPLVQEQDHLVIYKGIKFRGLV